MATTISVFLLAVANICFTVGLFPNVNEELANDIFEGLNETVHVCHYPFDFMCGTSATSKIRSNTLVEDNKQSKIDSFLQRSIKEITLNDHSVPTYKKWLRTYFDQCVNGMISTNESNQQIFKGLQRVIGAPPIFTDNKTAQEAFLKRNIWNLVGKVQRKLAEGVFFNTRVADVVTGCGKTKPTLTFEPLPVSDDQMSKTDMSGAVLHIADLLAVHVNQENNLSIKIDKMIELDKDLRQLINRSQLSDPQSDYIILTQMDDLKKLNRKIEWAQFFSGLFSKQQLTRWNQENAQFQIISKKYIQLLDIVLDRYDVETVFNYVFYKAMRSRSAKVLSRAESSIMIDLVPACIQSVKSTYSTAAVKLLFDYSNQNPVEWKSDLEIISDNIFGAFKSIVSKTSWLSVIEKATVFNKVNSIKFAQPIPDWINSDTEIERLSIKFDADRGLYDNWFNVDKWQFNLDLDRVISEDSSVKEIRFNQQGIIFTGETVQICFGTLFPPTYHFNYPTVAKYALIGSRIAEAMLDMFSADYLGDGSAEMGHWLDESKWHKLKEPIECMKHQMSSIDCKINASKCRDTGDKWEAARLLKQIDALRIAFIAFQLHSQYETTKNFTFDRLNEFNMEQLFYLLVGRSYCNSCLIASEEDCVRSWDKNRMLAIFRNLQSFAKMFKCPTATPAAEKTCGLWGNE